MPGGRRARRTGRHTQEALTTRRSMCMLRNGVTDGHGTFGYVVHVKPADFADAAKVLKL